MGKQWSGSTGLPSHQPVGQAFQPVTHPITANQQMISPPHQPVGQAFQPVHLPTAANQQTEKPSPLARGTGFPACPPPNYSQPTNRKARPTSPWDRLSSLSISHSQPTSELKSRSPSPWHRLADPPVGRHWEPTGWKACPTGPCYSSLQSSRASLPCARSQAEDQSHSSGVAANPLLTGSPST